MDDVDGGRWRMLVEGGGGCWWREVDDVGGGEVDDVGGGRWMMLVEGGG